jgi:cell division protein FtsL
MRGSKIIAIIAMVAALVAIGLAASLKYQQLKRNQRLHQLQQQQR